jgi:hypothetical protein
MAIYGDTLRDAASTFVHQLNSLLNKTLTYTPLQLSIVHRTENGLRSEIALVSFPRSRTGDSAIELKTRYGPMDLSLKQTLVAVPDENRRQVRLRTVSYGYTLQPHAFDDRLIRWEYVRFPGEDAFWSRHHVQGPLGFEILDDRHTIHDLTLNEWHLPTGWVPIEEVIRFCLHDLGSPALSPRAVWHAALIESVNAFRTHFSESGEDQASRRAPR